MNDSLRTDVFLRYSPETIACACIYLTARKLKIVLPKSPKPWYNLFVDADEKDIQDICRKIIQLYKRPKVLFNDNILRFAPKMFNHAFSN